MFVSTKNLEERGKCRLAISRQKKEELVAQYIEQIEQSSAIVFTDYRGTSVPQIQSLRAKLSETGSKYVVVKNSLLARALAECGMPQPEDLLSGPNGVAFIGEDIGQGVTAIKDWIKAARIVEIRGAILDQSVLDQNGADALADLPTKEQTLAMVLGAINAPASALVRMVNGPSASLARVINAYVEKQKESAA